MTNNTGMEKYFFRASAEDFKKITGSPIAYWVGKNMKEVFETGVPLAEIAKPRQGMATTNNDKFLRLWFEVSVQRIGFGLTDEEEAQDSHKKWFPYNKGGDFRKWAGNYEFIVNYENSGKEICDYIDNTPGARVNSKGRVINREHYFKESITWSFVSSAYFGVRYSPKGSIFDVGGSSVFPENGDIYWLVGFLCAKQSFELMKVMNPTLNFQVGNVALLPILEEQISRVKKHINPIVKHLIDGNKFDWDFYETSWDFTTLPLLASEHRQATLADTYQTLRQHWLNTTLEMQRLEEENNRIFIDAYGLQDELTPDVPLKEITLTCNPYYRYSKDAKQKEKEYPLDAKLEERLRSDTIAEFISYAVGCMFGRYSLDEEGLILANQGDGLKEYLAQVPNPSFEVDADNVLPILDDGWFTDDIVERFKRFLQITFGEQSLDENLTFVEKALGKDIRSYFVKDFYNDHVKRYKKRPIYWLFSSPKGSFNALIYMHRYRTDTVSVVLNEYLREFRTKLEAQVKYQETVQASASASQRDKTKALKELDRLKRIIVELDDYERDTLYPLATQQIAIDLDDGVKVNYPKFGKALKKITGLS